MASNAVKSSKCYQFAEDVISGKLISGVKRRQACERFMRELELSSDKGYRWKFDIEKAYRPIDFIEQFYVPTKGNYNKMELLPWQHFCEANLYGWVDNKTGLRRFREGIIFVGGGNGKSTLVTGNAAFGASKDGERGAEVYCIANAKEQAKIIFDECKAQIESSPLLKAHFRTTRDGIYFDRTNSKIQALASDPKTLDGKNVHLAIFDEVQDYRDYAFMQRLKNKTIKRRQPLVIYISTLGNVIDGPLMDLYVLGGQILANTGAVSSIVADRMFVYIDEIDEEDDPDNISCWGKANPSLGALLNLEELVAKWERSKMVPAERSDFINKQLNVFTSVDEMSFIDDKTILANNAEIDVKTLNGKPCYGGFDMSETEDFTSACLEFPLDDGCLFALSHSWVPEPKVKLNREKLDWAELQRQGWLTVIQGEFIRPEVVFEWFCDMSAQYRIQSIGYDHAKAIELVRMMTDKGFRLNVVRQGEITLTGPLDNLKEKFLDGKVVHNNNRLFNWYLNNVKLTKRSVNSTYLPTKQSKYRKIDGFAALLDAHTEMLRSRPISISPDIKVTRVVKLEV